MKTNPSLFSPKTSLMAVVILLITCAFPVSAAEHSDDTPVYWGGKKRAHVEDCVRYKRLSDDQKAEMTKMTFAQAQQRGIPLCTRCPGSRLGDNEDAKTGVALEDNTKVYWGGKKRVHVAICRRVPSDPEKREHLELITWAEAKAKGLKPCSRCPVQ